MIANQSVAPQITAELRRVKITADHRSSAEVSEIV